MDTISVLELPWGNRWFWNLGIVKLKSYKNRKINRYSDGKILVFLSENDSFLSQLWLADSYFRDKSGNGQSWSLFKL